MTWLRRHIHFNLFLATLAIVAAVVSAMPVQLHFGVRMMIAFDVAAIVYLLATIPPFSRLDAAGLRALSASGGDNPHILLMFGAVIVAVVMTALARELIDKAAISVLFSAFTLCLAWFFINTLFLLHYAHVFYAQHSGADLGGLEFPGTDKVPNAWDLAYFTFMVAIIFSVSDVLITSRRLRRIVMFHGMLAFAFNIFAIGVSIGLISNLFA